MVKLEQFLLFLALLFFRLNSVKCLPNIIIILADDLGWNDISFHGSNQFLTPNTDALAGAGMILHDYYTQPICTPARSALLTGRHPIHNGMQHDVHYAQQPWGLPLSEHLMPQYLQSVGYVTRAVGKWHLGFFKAPYTPILRGFDSHYGIWLGEQDYYTHTQYPINPSGYDFRRQFQILREAEGKYNTDLFTNESESIIYNHDVRRPLFLYVAHTAPHAPLQAPREVIDRFSYISDKNRQIFAAMVTKLDESVGRITLALKEKKMLDNSIILFMTDNGGATNGYNDNVASNFPLRGCKDTLWEGGVRGVGLIWSPLLQGPPRVHYGLFNVQDWLPTLLSATGNSHLTELRQLDGVSQWRALNNQAPAPYRTMLHNIDPLRGIAALRHGKWKIVIGTTFNGTYDGFYGQLSGEVPYNLDKVRYSAAGLAVQTTGRPLPKDSIIMALRAQATITCKPTTTSNTECRPQLSPCLFNIKEDPCETANVAAYYPQVVAELLTILQGYHQVPPNNCPKDPRSLPKYWNNTWINWQDFVH